jgi:glycosyltransferase involved in cell wall biosynthesis
MRRILRVFANGAKEGAEDTSFKIALQRADRARDERKWQEAAHAYAEAVAAAPDAVDVWVQYGHALKESGHRSKAEEAYRTALALDESKADTHLQLGHLLKLEGRLDAAAVAYLTAIEKAPDHTDALTELEHLIRRGVELPRSRIAAAVGGLGLAMGSANGHARETDLAAATTALHQIVQHRALDDRTDAAVRAALDAIRDSVARESERPARGVGIVFDVADLIGYWRRSRLPTGIQRVQTEVVRSQILAADRTHDVRVCAFSEAKDDWVEIPAPLFLQLSELSLESGDVRAPAWTSCLRRLQLFLLAAEPMDFSGCGCLVNLGTSWWLQNYFLQIRRIKARHEIAYVPFVHDLIPAVRPSYCIKELTQDFISWLLGVYRHADMYLVNSEATKRDLLATAKALGHDLSRTDVEVVRLDADFRRGDRKKRPDLATLRKQDLRAADYALMVGTIEVRKNHIGALNAWSMLIDKLGADKVPTLVCVGNQGWLNEEFHSRLASSAVLRSKVKILSGLSDDELADLYEHCLFTLYPSHYEGWGLPVTESLCYGKVVITSDASSLPEAGGPFAFYFQAGSDRDLASAVERLAFDETERRRREEKIRREFAPRSWGDVGRQIGTAAGRFLERRREAGSEPLLAVEPTAAELGVYYPMVRITETRVIPGRVTAEMYRRGNGWWWPDDWGAWTKPGGAELTIRIAEAHGPLRIWLRIRGVPDLASRWSLEISSPEGMRPIGGELAPEESRWVRIDIPGSDSGSLFSGILSADRSRDLAERTAGLDRRTVSVGLAGFFIHERENLADRIAFHEAVLLDDFNDLTTARSGRDDGFSVSRASGRAPL